MLQSILLPLLIALYSHLGSHGQYSIVPPDRAIQGVSIIQEVVQSASKGELLFKVQDESEGALAIAREKTARILTVFATFESNFKAQAIGDGGQSLGILQVNRMFIGNNTPQDVLKSPKLGITLGLAVMRLCVLKCGSIKSGLNAYATGVCYKNLPLITKRCKLAGLSENCD